MRARTAIVAWLVTSSLATGCEGAFAERYVSLVQMVLARSGWVPDELELTR